MRIASRALALILIAPAFGACKKTEPTSTGEAKPAAAPIAAKPAGEAAPTATAPTAAARTITYTHPDPKFTIQLPEGFVASDVAGAGTNMTSIRFAKPGEHYVDDKDIDVTWYTRTPDKYETIITSAEPDTGKLEEQDIAGGKGKFFYSRAKESHKVNGVDKEDEQFTGAAVVDGATVVFLCQAWSFDPAPAPTFIKACASFLPR